MTTDQQQAEQPARTRRGTATRRIFLAGVFAQAAIVVTGGLVRITGSGLGCTDWPTCNDDKLVVRPSDGFHGFVEFGNRLLTFVIGFVLIACVVAAWRMRPRRRPIVLLAALGFVGIPVQAALGGITVLTDLHPATVAAHFLVSMVLIFFAVATVARYDDEGDAPPVLRVRRELRIASTALVLVGAAVLVAGTVVTGSGPHSGDADEPARFGFDVRVVSWLHADLVLVFLGVLFAVLLGLRLTDAPRDVMRRAVVVLVVTLAQGAVGYVQYVTGVPEALVAAHLIGACVLWVSVLWFWFSTRSRGAVDRAVTPASAG
jgi:cytochrome c oxidase assembly protein subunit 15